MNIGIAYCINRPHKSLKYLSSWYLIPDTTKLRTESPSTHSRDQQVPNSYLSSQTRLNLCTLTLSPFIPKGQTSSTMASITPQIHPSSDPAIYQSHFDKFSAAPLPSTSEEWLQRAQEVSSILAVDAAAREKANKSPRAEVALLKNSGLTKILGPKKYGGGEQPWSIAYKAIRIVAKGDGSIGMLLGYHLLWSTTANVVGNAAQAERFAELITKNNYFLGGAVNPRDSDLVITYDDEKITFNGAKHFNTGGVVSDLTVLEGAVEGRPANEHIFAIVPTQQSGITFAYNWDNVGLRLTESGSVKIENVSAPWEDALGWDVATKKPDPAVLGIQFGTLFLPTIQLVFVNFYLGIAQGALEFASQYTKKNTRPWPYGGDVSSALLLYLSLGCY